MKNRRTITAALLVSALALLAVAGIVRWYRAGELPAGPGSFFNPRERERAQARLDANRLDLEPAVQLCKDVEDHLRRAAGVRFTNPEQAARAVRGLSSELNRLADTHRPTVDRMEAANPGTWREPYDRFQETASAHYAGALDLCEILSRQDWSAIGFPALLEQVVAAKELAARLQAGPVFSTASELRTTLYPAFEQAYSDRGESDPARLRRRLLRPQPAVCRWFYARLYQSSHALPADLCPDDLDVDRDGLLRLQEEVAAADVTGVLTAWTFPRGRADHLGETASLTRPLSEVESVRGWVRVVLENSSAWQALIDATAPDAESPDPELRDAAQWLIDTAHVLGRRLDDVRDYPTLAGVGVVVTAVDDATRSHRELLDCPARILALTHRRHEGLLQAGESLLSLPVRDDAENLAAAIRFRDAAAATAAALGEPIADQLVRDGLDHWFVRQWPEVRRLDQLATGIRGLRTQGIVTRPALAEASQLLDDIARSQSDPERQRLVAAWRGGLADAMAEFPLTARQIGRSLESLEQVTYREDLADAIRLREDGRMRDLAARILAADDTAADLRAAALACRAILDLPQRIHEFAAGRPDFNRSILPTPPPRESIIFPLYQERVAPVVGLAKSLPRIASADCLEALAAAANDLDRVRALYPHWQALDPDLEQAALAALPGCVSVDAAALRSLSSSIARLARIFPSLAKWNEYLTALLALVETDPEAGMFVQRLEAVEGRTEQVPAVTNFVAAGRALVEFQADSAAVDSFQRIRRQVSDLRDVPNVPTLSVYMANLYRRFTDGIDRLEPVVRMDMGMIRAERAASTRLEDLVESYTRTAADPVLPAPLQSYASGQADALTHYLSTNPYAVAPAATGKRPKAPVRIRYAVLSPDFPGLGFGLRRAGQGSALVLSLRTDGQTLPLLSADWEESAADGTIELSDIVFQAGSFTWQWGYPVEVGITVAHTRNGNRDLVPDAGGSRSRWNPLNYGLYRVETNHYPIATYPNLEALVRDRLLTATTNATAIIQFDRLLDPERPADLPPRLAFELGGLPPSRDLDWPQFLPPATAGDARALGEDLRRAATNLFESITDAITE